MFQKLKKIDNVKTFQVEEHLCYLHSNKGIVCSNGFVFDSDPSGSLYLIRNKLFKQSFRGELQIFDIEQNELLFKNNKDESRLFILPGFLESDSSVYVTRLSGHNEEFGLYNFKSKAFEHRINVVGQIIPQLQIGLNYGGPLSSVQAISLTDGRLLWTFNDLKKSSDGELLEDVRYFLGIYKLELWFCLSSGKLVALNSETGELIHELNANEDDRQPFIELVQFDRNQIIGLRGKCFMKIDLESPILQREYLDVSPSMKAHEIESSYRNPIFPCDEDFIYFCDDRQGKIGVFGRKDLAVAWSYQLDIERDGIAQILEMKYANNRWYVLDRHNTLHIFNRLV